MDPLDPQSPQYRQLNLVEVQEAMDKLMDHNQEVYVESVGRDVGVCGGGVYEDEAVGWILGSGIGC